MDKTTHGLLRMTLAKTELLCFLLQVIDGSTLVGIALGNAEALTKIKDIFSY